MFEKIIQKFKENNISVIPVENNEEACRKVLEIIPKKSSIGYGGSITLESIGLFDKIKSGDYEFYDKSKAVYGSEEYFKLVDLSQHVDYFLSSSNAITRDGKIVNMDRTGNRVSSIIFGPKHVIIVVGKNKIVDDVDSAIERIRNIAAPLNAKRLKLNTPCVKTGRCMDCSSPDSICCSTVIIHKQFKPNRITIILVNKDLGY
ncbi:MAG: lactate utilization protein [Candidatus Aenigmarchaeota archaeon]|nr:lactate utilization protein [Candidatus Aenigmarchaeota archaeon]